MGVIMSRLLYVPKVSCVSEGSWYFCSSYVDQFFFYPWEENWVSEREMVLQPPSRLYSSREVTYTPPPMILLNHTSVSMSDWVCGVIRKVGCFYSPYQDSIPHKNCCVIWKNYEKNFDSFKVESVNTYSNLSFWGLTC